jgi:hypothetical protein
MEGRMDRLVDVRAVSPYKLTAAVILLLSSSYPAVAQFHAIPNPDGETIVLDAAGVPVDIAPADPVGVKPDYCPYTSYYVYEVQSDKTELVLADCLTGLHQYTVDMQGVLTGPSE